MRLKYGIITIAGIVLIPIAILAWWLLSPLFVDKTVDEELPFAFNAVIPEGMTPAEVESIMASTAEIDQPVDEEMPSMSVVEKPTGGPTDEVVEDLRPMQSVPDKGADSQTSEVPTSDASAGEATSETRMDSESIKLSDSAQPSSSPPEIDIATETPMVEPPTDTSDAQPTAVRLKVGDFRDVDSAHRGSGQATIFQGPDGSRLLRLENLSVTNGPDLHLILTPHPNPESRNFVKAPGYVDLGKLKGNMGNQNYIIPDDVDISAQRSLVIYCKPFHVIFSVASLKDVG
ncbi:MAG: DM13 domain-containing protein [Dehalococcoidia bacterium]